MDYETERELAQEYGRVSEEDIREALNKEKKKKQRIIDAACAWTDDMSLENSEWLIEAVADFKEARP